MFRSNDFTCCRLNFDAGKKPDLDPYVAVDVDEVALGLIWWGGGGSCAPGPLPLPLYSPAP